MDLRSMRARSAEKRRWRFRRKAGPVPENPLWLRPMPSKTCALRSDRGTQRNSPRTPAGQGSLAMMRLLTRPRSSLLAIWGRLGTQPQGDVGWLHRLPHLPYQVVAQGVQVCLVPEPDREDFEGLPRVVLAAVETPIYEALCATPQRVEQGSYDQSGGDYGQLGLLLLASESAEGRLCGRHATEVDHCQHRSERAVDQRTINEEVYVVEVVLEHSDAHRHGYTSEAQQPPIRGKAKKGTETNRSSADK